MKLDKNYKVRVTPKQSRQIQELLFALGGGWFGGHDGKEPMMLDADYLFLHDSMVLTYAHERGNCYFENKHNHTEIQADDLIALLNEQSKSAENPLQGVELTPEFEAVEPVTAPRFQAGQKAYCPWLNVGRLVLLESNHTDYLFAETAKGKQYFNKNGTSVDVTSPAQPDLFHVTQENYELLSKLMPWVNFEQPPKPLTGSDLARAMLDKGWKYVPCFVSNESDDFAQKMKLTDLIIALDGDRSKEFVGDDVWRYAVPIDPRTGEPLTESILND